jgi:hypothetical protein
MPNVITKKKKIASALVPCEVARRYIQITAVSDSIKRLAGHCTDTCFPPCSKSLHHVDKIVLIGSKNLLSPLLAHLWSFLLEHLSQRVIACLPGLPCRSINCTDHSNNSSNGFYGKFVILCHSVADETGAVFKNVKSHENVLVTITLKDQDTRVQVELSPSLLSFDCES